MCRIIGCSSMGSEGMNNSIQKIGSIVVIIVSLVTIAGAYYEIVYDKPILTYEILNTYPLPDQSQIVPVIIKNEGHAKASNVRIIIEAEGERVNVMYKSLE